LTADGELVLLHDPLLDLGTTVSGWVHEHIAAQIRAARLRHLDGTASEEHPLLLDELLELAPAGATLQLEVKAHADPALAQRTTQAICDRLADHPARGRSEILSFFSARASLAPAGLPAGVSAAPAFAVDYRGAIDALPRVVGTRLLSSLAAWRRMRYRRSSSAPQTMNGNGSANSSSTGLSAAVASSDWNSGT
jgi:glycerophosphoryl diester phosphodiesterase